MEPEPAQSVSTVIIGGGIVGTSIAYYLASLGESGIVLIEAKELAAGSTGGSLGGVRQQFSTSPQVEIALRGREFWSSFESVFGKTCDWHQDGYLMMTGDPEVYSRLSAAADVQRACGATAVEMLDPGQINELVPWVGTDGLIGACWTPLDGRVNPTDGVYALAAEARRMGVTIVQNDPVLDITQTERGWKVQATNATVDARRVIVAAGFSTPPLVRKFGLDVDISPSRLHVGITDRVLVGERLPMTIDLDTGFCVERENDGAAVSVLGLPPSPNQTPQDMLGDFAELAEVRAPTFTEVRIRSTMTGYPDRTGGDGNPFIGEFEPGLWIAAGFDGHGTMQGPAFGKLIANEMAGIPDPVIDMSIFDPRRETPVRIEWLKASKASEQLR